jgi:hypothetical protein
MANSQTNTNIKDRGGSVTTKTKTREGPGPIRQAANRMMGQGAQPTKTHKSRTKETRQRDVWAEPSCQGSLGPF